MVKCIIQTARSCSGLIKVKYVTNSIIVTFHTEEQCLVLQMKEHSSGKSCQQVFK